MQLNCLKNLFMDCISGATTKTSLKTSNVREPNPYHRLVV
jgi:hypothetical protein